MTDLQKENEALRAQLVAIKKKAKNAEELRGYLVGGEISRMHDSLLEVISKTPEQCLAEIEAAAVSRAVDYLIEKSACSIYAHDVIASMPRKEASK